MGSCKLYLTKKLFLGTQKFQILATVCDGTKECLDDIDESKCEVQEKVSNYVMCGLLYAFFIVFFFLEWYSKSIEGIGNDKKDITLIQQDFDSLLSQYKEDHFDKNSSQNLNLYFLHFLNSTDESPERPRQCYVEEMDYHQGNFAEVCACIHQNFDERVCEREN